VLTWSRGSIGFVGEVFEVVTQVDLGWTSVSRFDLADLVIGGNNANKKPGASQRHKKSSEASDSDCFPARLHDQLLPEKFKPLGITKYDAKQDPVQWLRCYALSIENAGGNNDTKCLYFPFCLDQEPLTWLESLDKNSIDEWDQLKA
jgi:hypothetical protein